MLKVLKKEGERETVGEMGKTNFEIAASCDLLSKFWTFSYLLSFFRKSDGFFRREAPI